MTKSKCIFVAVQFSLILGIGCALIGYVGYLYPPYEKAPSEAVSGQTKTIKVTAYCPCEICCGKWADGQTASGYWIQPGDRFVAAPKHIPFGTKMIIPGYNDDKPVEVKDRGGAITVERLDVYFDTHQEALIWGVQYLEIKQND